MRAMLMRTCLADVVAPSIPRAARAVLERCGVEVTVPGRQTCCGQPGWSSGHPEQARRVARQALRAFAGDDPVVVPSGSCAAMVRHGYPDLFAGEPEEAAARAMAERTLELTQFLAREGLDPGATGSGSATYHDSCHMLRLLGERESGRACRCSCATSRRS
jgi:L-lactate dehydrogenase complex protein LldE